MNLKALRCHFTFDLIVAPDSNPYEQIRQIARYLDDKAIAYY